MFNTFSHGLLFWKCFTMTQYLIKTITHNTGEVFYDVVKARENEVFTLVEAESEDEARETANKPKRPLSYYTSKGSKVTLHELPSEERLQEMFGKDFRKNRK